MRREGRITCSIARGSVAAIMGLAIDLDRQLGAGAVEVEDIGQNRVLAAKLQSVRFKAETLP